MTDLSCPLCGAPAEKAKMACPCCKRSWGPELAMLNVEKVHCKACGCSFDFYLLDAESRALIDGVKKALKDQDEGRNSSCWPLVSFGWKDADLDAEGCTGIKGIVGAEQDKLVFGIGGHKTFVSSDCLDTNNEKKRAAFDGVMQDIVCSTGYPGEWSGDDWCVSFSDTVALAIIRKDGEPDFEATATEIICLAQEACRGFEEEMASANKAADRLYIEMAAPPKKAKAKKVAKKSKARLGKGRARR